MGMFTTPMELSLTATERDDLERLVRATTTPAGIVRRARCVLLLADGHSYSAVCTALSVTDRFIARWKRRFTDGGASRDAPGHQGSATECDLDLSRAGPLDSAHWRE